jgi:hypothetical protein
MAIRDTKGDSVETELNGCQVETEKLRLMEIEKEAAYAKYRDAVIAFRHQQLVKELACTQGPIVTQADSEMDDLIFLCEVLGAKIDETDARITEITATA